MVNRYVALGLCFAACSALAAAPVAGAQSGSVIANGAVTLAVRSPAGILRRDWNVGFAGGGVIDGPIGRGWNVTGSVEGGSFPSRDFNADGLPTGGQNLQLLGVAFGVRHPVVTPLYAGVTAGYYWYRLTNNRSTAIALARVRNGPGIHPTIGLHLGPIDLSVLYKLGGDAEWIQARAGAGLSF